MCVSASHLGQRCTKCPAPWGSNLSRLVDTISDYLPLRINTSQFHKRRPDQSIWSCQPKTMSSMDYSNTTWTTNVVKMFHNHLCFSRLRKHFQDSSIARQLSDLACSQLIVWMNRWLESHCWLKKIQLRYKIVAISCQDSALWPFTIEDLIEDRPAGPLYMQFTFLWCKQAVFRDCFYVATSSTLCVLTAS